MAVKLDLIDGSSGKKTVNGWEEIERIATVTGATGSGHTKIINAATVSGVPAIGDVHPGLRDCFLYEIVPTPSDSDTVRLRLLYKQQRLRVSPLNSLAPLLVPKYNTVEVGATLSQAETSYDRLGDKIEVNYTYPIDYTPDPTWAKKYVPKSPTVAKLIPEHHITERKQEFANPSQKALDYVGCVNSGPWSLARSSAAGTWLCTGIIGISNDGRVTFDVVYTFQYRADTWKSLAQFTDPNTGDPTPEKTAAQTAALISALGGEYKADNATRWVELYPIRDFNRLGL